MTEVSNTATRKVLPTTWISLKPTIKSEPNYIYKKSQLEVEAGAEIARMFCRKAIIGL